MNFQTVMQLIGRWGGTLNFFPSDPDARIGIAEEIVAMAATEEQVRWLVSRLPKLYKDWPAMLEVRSVFCSKFKPKDGIETYSNVYLDGIPSEKDQMPAIAAAPVRQLAAGEPASAAASLNEYITEVAKLKSLDRVLSGASAPKVPDIPVQRFTAANAITAADMERAEQEYRAAKRRALEELAKAEMDEGIYEAKEVEA